jgi:TIR domain/WD40-like Beta Propeller Repeat
MRVFINYRRGVTSTTASRLYEWLAARYGDNQVFMDVDTIVPGRPWREAIDRAVGSSDLVLAVIGKDWLPELNRRLADEDDFMRHELETALRRDISIIPILAEGARMPRSDELPESLAAFSDYQAFELLGRFQFDKQELLKSVDRALGLEREVTPSPEPPTGPMVTTPAPTEVLPADSAAAVGGSRLRRPPVRWRSLRRRHVALVAGLLVIAGITAIAVILAASGSPSQPRWATGLLEQEPIRNLDCPTQNCSQPSLAPGSTMMAFIGSTYGSVYVADISGSNSSGSTPVAGAERGIRPSLARPGNVVFRNQTGGRIWYTNASREHPEPLTAGPYDYDPVWSPDGSQVAFTSKTGDNSYALFKIDVPPRGKPTELASARGSKMDVPAWSPDGTRIAFIRASGECPTPGDVWILNADGTDAHRLLALSGDERHPTWSPDNRKIAFSSDVADPGNYDLYTVNADGSHMVRRTADAEDEVGPSWGADGIVYARGAFNCAGATHQRLWFARLHD